MRILYVTTISLTINSFFKPHIEMLKNNGNTVDIACNFSDLPIDDFFNNLGSTLYQVDFSRSPLSKDNIKAYFQLKKIIENGNYDIVHCHTPNASVITRLVSKRYRKKNGLKVFYTAHGFHFYKGAPIKNWILYYPIEKFCSRYTDRLITINKEDFELAKSKLKAKNVSYVPGVGIDFSDFENAEDNRNVKRDEIGVPRNAFLLLSVGELNENKNHQIIIKALKRINNPNIHYAIAGVGDKKDYLIKLADELDVSAQVHLLGYRNDIPKLNSAADVFCFPSIREGLPVAPIEAMACGLPIVAAKNRGTDEFVVNGENGFLCKNNDEKAFAVAIAKLNDNKELYKRFSDFAPTLVKRFDIKNIVNIMKEIYEKTF